MTDMTLRYYTVSLLVDKPNAPLHTEQSRCGWLSLTANIRLAINNAARLDNRELAEQLVDRCRPIFDKRYGRDRYEVAVNEQRGPNSKTQVVRIKKDSDIVRARIATNNFAPNQPVDLSAVRPPAA